MSGPEQFVITAEDSLRVLRMWKRVIRLVLVLGIVGGFLGGFIVGYWVIP